VIPQKRWEEAKRRLNEEAKRTATLLLNRCDLGHAGIEIPRKLKPALHAQTNFVAALQMVNEQIDVRIGKGRRRNTWSAEEFLTAMESLSTVLDGLTRELKGLQNAQK
jgi:hypothetical protein